MFDEKRKDHITFSVRGQKVETTLKTLSIFPDSKLYHLAKYLLRHVEYPEKQHERRATAPPALQTKSDAPKTTTVLAVIPATPTSAQPTEKKDEPKHEEGHEGEKKEAGSAVASQGDFEQDNFGVTLVHEHREIHNHFPLASQDYTYETHSFAVVGEPHVVGTPKPTGHPDSQPPHTPSAGTQGHKDCCQHPHTEKPAPKTFAEQYPHGYPLDRDHQTFLKLLHYHDVIAGCGRVHYDAFVSLEAKYWDVDYPHESKEGVYLAIITAQRSEGMLRGHFTKYVRLSEFIDVPFDWTPLESMLDYEFIGLVRKHLDEDWEHKWRLVGLAGNVIEDGDEVRGSVILEHK
jgi:hypothetical protein